jgi:outer membrane protein OmpA-like peptidoglycan-associated protein
MMRSVLFAASSLALATAAYAGDVRQATYTFHFDGAGAEARETFVIHDGISSIPPLAGAARNPSLTVRMTKDLPPVASIKAPEAPVTPVKVEEPRVGMPIEAAYTVLFELGSATLSKEEEKKLSAFLDRELADGNKKRARVSGYTCDIGPAPFNDRLARRRAETVASFLKGRGVTPTTVAGSGKCCYVSKVRRLNRRVHITLRGENV